MLKIAANIILSVVVLVSTSGFTISKHYCGSRLVDVAVMVEAENCCGDEGSSGCCHNETEYFQLEADYLISIVGIDLQEILPDIVYTDLPVFITDEANTGHSDILNFAESPPQPDGSQIISLKQAFLL